MIPSEYATIEPAADPRPGPVRMRAFLGVADQVPHDQEVVGEPHFLDDPQFVLDAFPHRSAEIQPS